MAEQKLWAEGVDLKRLTREQSVQVVRETGIAVGHLLEANCTKPSYGVEMAVWGLLYALREAAQINWETTEMRSGEALPRSSGIESIDIPLLLTVLEGTKKALHQMTEGNAFQVERSLYGPYDESPSEREK